MNKIYKNKILTFFLLILSLSGCDDFLTTDPLSQYSVNGAYKTPADFTYAIAGAYGTQKNIFKSSGLNLVLNVRCDEVRGRGMNGVENFTDHAKNPDIDGFWSCIWQVIMDCNYILDKIDAVDFPDANMKNSIKGEAYALRGWGYNMLGCLFGGMPLYDRILTVDETMSIKRSSQEETFAFAENEYKKAIDLLPTTWTGKNEGRITKYAAEGLLARMYMFQSKFSLAKPYLSDIINSGKYGMEEKYVDCFTDSKDNGKERVLEIQFCGGQQGQGQSFATNGFPSSYIGDIPYVGNYNGCRVADTLMVSFEDGDLRKDVATITNININGVIESNYSYVYKFSHFDAYQPKDKNDWANNYTLLRYTDVLMMYAECLNEEAYSATGEAIEIINDVRHRAGLNPLTEKEVPDQNAFRKAIQDERRIEFAFEGIRWFDLIRWGIVVDIMNDYFKLPANGNGQYFMEDYRKIFAIPYDEILRYNNTDIMWQNPMY